MKFTVGELVDGNRGVFIDDNPEPNYYIEENELQNLLKETRLGLWSNDQIEGQKLGKSLFNLFNRNNGELSTVLEKNITENKDLFLYLSLPLELAEIPFELLYNNDFIAVQDKAHIIRTVKEKGTSLERENRLLKILFVSASSVDLEHSTLQFEKEEDLFFKIAEKYPLDFQVEDTGSLDGIKRSLNEIQGTDILHITGHAGYDSKLGPVFYMEDEFGHMDKVTPQRLYDNIKNSPPKILFLAGCSTGKSDKNIGIESFAFQMVNYGIPFVLSWGLPVSDTGAADFAGVLYEKLANGKPITYAINEAILSVKDNYHPWSLLRLFTDGTECEGLVKEGQNSLKKSARQVIHKNLFDSNVKILENGFVGRRRALQQGLAVLNNKAHYENKHGLLITGPAGVGKSCLAGRIFERQSSYKDVIILRGKLEQNIVIHELKKFFDKQGYEDAKIILGKDISYEDKIKNLYMNTLKEKNIIIYFDDFEQNLYLKNDTWYLLPEIINSFRPFLQYIDYTKNQSKIIIASRYAFDLQAEGKNPAKRFLHEIPLMSFTGADENKKLNELSNIAKSSNIDLYREFGNGNPRLLEWLEIIAADEEKYNLNELKDALEGKEEEYKQKYLADLLAKTEGSEFEKFLRLSSVYRLPLEEDAFNEFGNKTLLDKGVDLSLFEKNIIPEQKERYWVMPIIRLQMWKKLNKEEQGKAHRTALKWYDGYLENNEILSYHNEAKFHALELKDIDSAARHVLPLGDELNNLLYYIEQKSLLEEVLSFITDSIIEHAKKDKDQSISDLLNQYSNLSVALGDAKKAVENLGKALEIDLTVHGDKHSKTAVSYSSLGLAYKALGDAKKAVEYLDKALEIDVTVYNDKHPKAAADYSNLGMAYRDLGDAKKAVEYLYKALEIDVTAYGDKHPNAAADYNNLGLAYQDSGDAEKAVEYLDKALKTAINVYSDKHPKAAAFYNNLGLVYQDLGDAEKAVQYLDKALEIDISVYGDKHLNVATRCNNLGLAYQDLGDAKKAAQYLYKALKIVIPVYGDKHPNVAASYNNLGMAYKDSGFAKKAVECLDKALEININVYGDKHAKTAASYHNLGMAYKDLGDAEKAVEYLRKALEIDITVYGDKHPDLAPDYNNLGMAYKAFGNAKKAVENLSKALEIDITVYGDKNPDLAPDYNNLGMAYKDLGDTEKAVKYLEKALEIDTTAYGDKHFYTFNDYLNLVLVYRSENKFDDEYKYLLKFFELIKNIEGVTPELIKSTENRIEKLKTLLNK